MRLKAPFYTIVLWLITSHSALAEIQLDGSLGTFGSQAIPLSESAYEITPNMGQSAKHNLFYSFERFNLANGQTANFHALPDTHNIISRVTGGQRSIIDGTLSTVDTAANFFFINPYGIQFNENATLDIEGSVHFSTAHYLEFADTTTFSAVDIQNPLLSTAPPQAFGFWNTHPIADINKNQASLELTPTENHPNPTLTFIGGDIEINDFTDISQQENPPSLIRNTNGNIHLISVASEGKIPIQFEQLENISIEEFGNISIKDDIPLENGRNRIRANIDTSGQAGGNIYIRGGKIELDNAYLYADRTNPQQAIPSANSNSITLIADNILLKNAANITIESPAVGQANDTIGEIELRAEHIEFTEGSRIASTSGVTTAANIKVKANQQVKFTGQVQTRSGISYSGLTSRAIFAPNSKDNEINAGDIHISAPVIILDEGLIESNTTGNGDAGKILMETEQLKISNGGIINTSSQAGTTNKGNAGFIKITGADQILIEEQNSGIFSNTFTEGQGGNIEISAETLMLTEQGRIEAGTAGKGNGGAIDLTVMQLDLKEGAIILTKSDNSEAGDGGNITINSKTLQMTDNAELAADAALSNGGNITLQVQRHLKIDNNSKIITRVNEDFGNGGDIIVQAGVITLTNGSTINANAAQGKGGNIQINTLGLFNKSLLNFDPQDDDITATSQRGIDGEINIDTAEDLILENLTLPFTYTVEQPYNCLIPSNKGVLSLKYMSLTPRPSEITPSLYK